MTIQRYLQARNVTLIGAGGNLFLAIIKIIFGWLGRSSGLFADGIHSLSDLLTDALVVLASFFGSRQADWDHPYGHRRIETAATLFLALLVSLAGFFIAWESLQELMRSQVERPQTYVVWVALISVIVNEGLYHFTLHAGRRIQSNLLIANAWHHRSDAGSSFIVLVGIIGSLIGYHHLDAVAAIIVGMLIIKMGIQLGWSSVKELVDTGVPAELLEQIRSTILNTPDVQAVHQLRTRHMGETILVDAHVLVQSRISVSEGHYIAAQVYQNLVDGFDQVNDVTIHIDPENDEEVPINLSLPARETLTPQLMSQWADCPGVEAIDDLRLHYLNECVEIELVLPLKLLESYTAEDIEHIYWRSLTSLSFISHLKVLFKT